MIKYIKKGIKYIFYILSFFALRLIKKPETLKTKYEKFYKKENMFDESVQIRGAAKVKEYNPNSNEYSEWVEC